jgi:heme-degrading monooxygenase HmoA
MTRRTAIKDRAQWEESLRRALPRLEALMRRAAGFESVHYLFGVEGDGSMAEVTRWRSRAEYDAYLRNGLAATAATILDAALPTAPYPDGNWARQSFETAL